MNNKMKKIQKNIGMFRIILFGWMMFGLGVFASGKFGGKMAIGFTLASVALLIGYDTAFDKYLKGR
ncbi:hypothetical protein [Enterococcus cecorum]|uniref:hypothetical protein n=1 Tax=Enterococcus cecorum TaxID=44008 RepID=UPI000ACEBDCA|nr:hypothetical protein [Enterococcus cecorum]CAI3346532.1 hypothetical protein CIRMBP1308_00402 [Enterococcus cecorum]